MIQIKLPGVTTDTEKFSDLKSTQPQWQNLLYGIGHGSLILFKLPATDEKLIICGAGRVGLTG
jgi:hypothetical protein